MGATPYTYFVPYEPNIRTALNKLRMKTFQNKEFHGAEFDPPTPEAAVALTGEVGTCSILDIFDISDRPAIHRAAPLSAEECEDYFGTPKPTKDMVLGTEEIPDDQVRGIDEMMDDLVRGEARYIIVYDNDGPNEIYFVGYSFN